MKLVEYAIARSLAQRVKEQEQDKTPLTEEGTRQMDQLIETVKRYQREKK